MSNYTNFEVSKRLWDAGVRNGEQYSVFYATNNGIKRGFFGRPEGELGIDYFPCYDLGQLVRMIYSIEPHGHLTSFNSYIFPSVHQWWFEDGSGKYRGLMGQSDTFENALGLLICAIKEESK